MNFHTLLLVGAVIAFLLDAFKVQNARINWTPLGFALVTASFLV